MVYALSEYKDYLKKGFFYGIFLKNNMVTFENANCT